MASEAEFERLYQEFVRRGGGTYTFDGSAMSPAEYYDVSSGTTLTAEQISKLEAAQEQFNRQSALNTFNAEIQANNFTNPYTDVANDGRNAFIALASDPGVVAVNNTSNAIGSVPDPQLQNDIINLITGLVLDPTSSPVYGTQVYYENTLFGVPTLSGIMLPIYDDLETHTNSQVSDFPQTLSDVTALTSMNQQFGEQNNSCDSFNQLMGILSGIMDPALDFLKGIGDTIINALSPFIDIFNSITTSINDFINGSITDILGAISGIIDPVKAVFDKAMGLLNNVMGDVTNVIGNLTNQLLGEMSGLLGLADKLLAMAQALAMAAASFDICQLAALLKVGGPNIRSAVTQLTTPLSSVLPTVPTEVDARANPTAVTSALAAATRTALASPGVPQSPFTAAASLYEPVSAYLHSQVATLSGYLSEAFTTSITASGAVISKLIPTFASGLGSQGGGNASDTGARPSETITSVRSRSHSDFTANYSDRLLQSRNQLKKFRITVTTSLPNLTTENQTQAKIIVERLQAQEAIISSTLNSSVSGLTYTVVGNINSDEIKEEQIAETYNTLIKPKVERTITRSNTLLELMQGEYSGLTG